MLIVLIVFFLFSSKMPTKLKSPVKKLQIRGCDLAGCGYYGAKRISDGKQRLHYGIDIIVEAGEVIYAPLSGTIRRFNVYDDSKEMKGYEIKNGDTAVKLMYVNWTDKYPTGSTIKQGEPLSTAQDVAKYYKSSTMTKHIHCEVLINGKKVDPTPYFT